MATDRKLGIIELSKLTDMTNLMANNTNLTTVNCPFPNVTIAANAFFGCTNLVNVNFPDVGDQKGLGKAKNCDYMLYAIAASQVSLDLPVATTAISLLQNSPNLTSLTINAPLVTNFYNAIQGTPITTLNGNLSSLVNFVLPASIISIDIDLSSVVNGEALIQYATKIESIKGSLSSVTSFGKRSLPSDTFKTFEANLSSLKTGDKLFYGCTNMTSFKPTSLGNLETGVEMFYRCTGMQQWQWELDMKKLTDGTKMFADCTTLQYVNSHMGALDTATDMFNGCTQLRNVYIHLASLSNGSGMFAGCTNLNGVLSQKETSGKRDYINLDKLTDGSRMFYKCNSLNAWYSDMAVLSNGAYMFGHTGLLNFAKNSNSNVAYALDELVNGTGMFIDTGSLDGAYMSAKKLVDGTEMFYQSHASYISIANSTISEVEGGHPTAKLTNGSKMFAGCANISKVKTTFSSGEGHVIGCNTYNLKNGDQMFYNCTSLTSFEGRLDSLLSGYDMFHGCKLDKASLENISKNINNISSIYNPDTQQSEDANFVYEAWTELPPAQTVGEEGGEPVNPNITLKVISPEKRGIIHIGCMEPTEQQIESGEIPESAVTDAYKLSFEVALKKKGWRVHWCKEPDAGTYDISSSNGVTTARPGGYVTDVEDWRTEIYEVNGLKITSITYDGTNGVMNGTSKWD